jgi:hypothetical protein
MSRDKRIYVRVVQILPTYLLRSERSPGKVGQEALKAAIKNVLELPVRQSISALMPRATWCIPMTSKHVFEFEVCEQPYVQRNSGICTQLKTASHSGPYLD